MLHKELLKSWRTCTRVFGRVDLNGLRIFDESNAWLRRLKHTLSEHIREDGGGTNDHTSRKERKTLRL